MNTIILSEFQVSNKYLLRDVLTVIFNLYVICFTWNKIIYMIAQNSIMFNIKNIKDQCYSKIRNLCFVDLNDETLKYSKNLKQIGLLGMQIIVKTLRFH